MKLRVFRNNRSIQKYAVEGVLIVGSILFSFLIEGIVREYNKIQLKETILSELSMTINQDLIQLNQVIEIEEKCIEKASLLIDDYSRITPLNDREIASNYSYLKEYGHLSFFLRKGPFIRLLETGSLELIENEELRKKLLLLYDNINKRKEFGDQMIDDFGMRIAKDLADFIVLSEEKNSDVDSFYSGRDVKFYKISNDYYNSNLVLYYFNEYKVWIGSFIDLHGAMKTLLNEIQLLIDQELG